MDRSTVYHPKTISNHLSKLVSFLFPSLPQQSMIGQQTAPTIRKALNLKAFNNSQSNDSKSPLTWKDLQDLPLEFPEDESLMSEFPSSSTRSSRCRFHSVFTCPVSREVATPGNLFSNFVTSLLQRILRYFSPVATPF